MGRDRSKKADGINKSQYNGKRVTVYTNKGGEGREEEEERGEQLNHRRKTTMKELTLVGALGGGRRRDRERGRKRERR